MLGGLVRTPRLPRGYPEVTPRPVPLTVTHALRYTLIAGVAIPELQYAPRATSSLDFSARPACGTSARHIGREILFGWKRKNELVDVDPRAFLRPTAT